MQNHDILVEWWNHEKLCKNADQQNLCIFVKTVSSLTQNKRILINFKLLCSFINFELFFSFLLTSSQIIIEFKFYKKCTNYFKGLLTRKMKQTEGPIDSLQIIQLKLSIFNKKYRFVKHYCFKCSFPFRNLEKWKSYQFNFYTW